MKGQTMDKTRKGCSYRACGYPGFCTGIPTCYEEAESMTCAKGDASEKSPLFTLYPVVIPYVVCIGKQRIERKEWEGVEMRVPREGDMQARSSDFG